MGLRDFLKEYKRAGFGFAIILTALSAFISCWEWVVYGVPFLKAFLVFWVALVACLIFIAFCAFIAVYFEIFD